MTKVNKRSHFAELTEGFEALAASRERVKATAFEASAQGKRLGFLSGEISVPDDFNAMGAAEIDQLFRGRR